MFLLYACFFFKAPDDIVKLIDNTPSTSIITDDSARITVRFSVSIVVASASCTLLNSNGAEVVPPTPCLNPGGNCSGYS